MLCMFGVQPRYSWQIESFSCMLLIEHVVVVAAVLSVVDD